jgi:hypothetical protein
MKYLLLALSFVFSGSLFSQSSVNSSGANAEGTGGSANYSVGQTFYTSQSSTSGSISQGVQQTYISSITSIDNSFKNIELSIYPNPTTNQVTLSLSDYNLDNLSYNVFDINGKLILTNRINSNAETIYFNDLNSSIYFVKIIENDKELKTFKVLKTN